MADEGIMNAMKTDRISTLPIKVISHILSYLSYRSVIRTSLLSRNWRYKWMFIPRLIFDREFCESLECDMIAPTVYRALLLHRGPLLEFKLWWNSYVTRVDIDTWILFLSGKQIQVFCLEYILFQYSDFVMPNWFFSFDHLTHLHLDNVSIKTPPAFKGFTKLISLVLRSIRIEFEDFTRFLSKCPSVEFLCLGCWKFKHLYVNAPNLKHFKYGGNFCPIFIHATVIEELSLDYFNGVSESIGVEPNWITAFGYLLNVKKLNLSRSVYKYLARFGIPQNSKLKNLTVIELSDADFEMTYVVNCAVCLLRSAPNLQRLKIIIGWHYWESDTVVQQQEFEEPLPCLKNVEIHRMSGTESEMEFVRLILQWATVLEKLEFKDSCCNSSSEEGFKMRGKLVDFPRASSLAEVII